MKLSEEEGNSAWERIADRLDRLNGDYFIGRSFELRFFERFLDDGSRRPENIINLFGTGGMGKSYLLEQYGRIARRLGSFIHSDGPAGASGRARIRASEPSHAYGRR
ncbi:ATP-binding protein [Paenibacillus sp. P25]|nr:ATP-binding protein [Paenibacillus sp. P25]